MNPKDGKAGKASAPLKPTRPKEADTADPGKMASKRSAGATTGPSAAIQATSGGAGSSGAGQTASGAAGSSAAEQKVWISIELQDTEGNPVADTPYEIKVPNEDTLKKGKLDGNGKAIIEGISPGNCLVCFPDIHEKEWIKISEQNEKGGR